MKALFEKYSKQYLTAIANLIVGIGMFTGSDLTMEDVMAVLNSLNLSISEAIGAVMAAYSLIMVVLRKVTNSPLKSWLGLK